MHTMDPQQLLQQGRREIIDALNIGHLAKEEQDAIVDKLGTVLMQRVLVTVFDMLPDAERARFEELLNADQMDAVQALIQKNIPNAQEVIQNEIRDGVREHIERVNATTAAAN
jgi:hypothetical protein